MRRWGILFTLLGTACLDLAAEPTVDHEVVALGPPGSSAIVTIPRQSTWSYRTDQGAWLEGDAPLGYGEAYITTTVPAAQTAYFRREFSVGDVSRIRRLYLRVMYDDGVVVYVNGHEAARASMPAGPVVHGTLATGHEADDAYVTFDLAPQIANLVTDGVNTIAVEVHQQTPSSSDLVFDAELITWVDPPFDPGTPRGVTDGAYWMFWDGGGALGSAWRTPGYDDAGWSSAPGVLGFGEPYVVTELARGPITHYFRTTFDRAGAVRALRADVMFDDGFVAYLNGHEIARVGLPPGDITASTLAVAKEPGARYDSFDWSAAIPFLVDGKNTLAVEVHQATVDSPDLVLDLALDFVGETTAMR